MRPAGCNLSPETGFIKGNFMDEAQDMPPAEPDEDAKLMLRVRNGDASAMEMLVRKHQNSVYATVARMLNNGPETEDIAQQVFIRIWKGAGNYEPSARFTTWMFTILRNLVFNEVRRQKRKPTTSADAMEEEGGMAVFLEPSRPRTKHWNIRNSSTPWTRQSPLCRKRRGWPSNCAVSKTCPMRK